MSRVFGRLSPLVAGALLALPVRASEPVPVAVVPYAPIHGELSLEPGNKAAILLAAELEADPRFVVREISEPGAGAKKRTGEADLARARKEVEGAVAQFGSAGKLAARRRMSQAVTTYDRAIKRFTANFQGADDFKELSEAYLQFAITRFKMGSEKDAARLLGELVRIDPARVLEAPEVPPVFAKFHADIRTAELEKQRGQVRVTSNPSGATVTFDGRVLGSTPMVLREVLPGEHFVRVVAEGQGGHWQKVKVTAGEELALEVRLGEEASGPYADLQRALATNTLDAGALAQARRLGRDAGAAFVLLGAMQGETDAIRAGTVALRVEDGAVTALRELRFDLELLGGAIEIYNLVSDLGDKVANFPGSFPDEAVRLLSRVRPKTPETVTSVRVTPSAGQSSADAVAGRRRPVGPVGPANDGRRPVVAPQDQAEQSGPATGLRRRGRIGQEAEHTSERAAVEDEDVREVNLAPVPRSSGTVGLSPEEMKRLHEVEAGGKRSRKGQIALWSGVGVAGAAVLATGAYFLFAPSTPTSATAHVSWNPNP